MEKWREKLKNKPVRYWIRDEIEEIMKEEKIDRTRFCEYAKTEYQKVINEFYYSFADYTKFPTVELAYVWLHFREDLIKSHMIYEKDYTWNGFLKEIRNLIASTGEEKCYMIVSEGWVYEGYPEEICRVLGETDGLLEDFYIVSKRYNWTFAYCSDGLCAVMYENGKR